MSQFRVDNIDHVELFVPDRHEAAKWYEKALGLRICPNFVDWAADSGGPLMIETADGRSKLALFQGQATNSEADVQGFRRVAFGISADGFARFVASVAERNLRGADGQVLKTLDIVDHGKSHSVYFRDPWGHALEVTTYEVNSTE